MAVGNCRSSSNFWAFISQACFIILKINLFYDTNESAKWKNNRAVYVKKQFLCSPSCFIIFLLWGARGFVGNCVPLCFFIIIINVDVWVNLCTP
jgi:hypothetical protein